MIDRARERWTPPVWSAGLLFIALAAGCSGTHHAPQVETPKPAAAQVSPAPAGPPQAPVAKSEPVPAVAAQSAPKQESPAVEPAAPSAAPPTAPIAAKPAAQAATPSEKTAATAAPKKEAATPPAPKPAAAPLDLTTLEKRLKETNAIGVFTKLTLKNQVDALLEQFRGYYQGRVKTTLVQLRQPYDQLLLKVLSLLQDADPPLAHDIAVSREAIWGILSDPDKFKDL